MDLTHPLNAITTPLYGQVLQALSATTGQHTGRRVHRLAGAGSVEGVRQVLNRLVEQGLVLAEEQDHATLFELNRRHVLTDSLVAMLNVRGQVFDRIKSQIETWEVQPRHASLFGSFARGEAGRSSDIDVLVIAERDSDRHTDAWDQQIDRLSTEVLAWTGNRADIVDIGDEALHQLIEADDPLLQSWRGESIQLAGQPLLESLKRSRAMR